MEGRGGREASSYVYALPVSGREEGNGMVRERREGK